MSETIQKLIRLFYKYSIAVKNSLVLFFRSFMFLPLRTWLRFWMPGVFSDGKVIVESLLFTLRSHRLLERVADLYMIMTCVRDQQYTPPNFEIQTGDTVIDIGGHIGSFSVSAAKKALKGHVYVFEPNPSTFAILQKNIALNNTNNITSLSLAVSEEKGTRSFYASNLNTAESGFYKKNIGGEEISVQSISLNDIFEQYHIISCDFLKLDCEGAEYEILFTSSPECLRRVKKIAMECHNPLYFNLSNPRYSQDAMKQFLRNNGFTVREVKENAMHSLLFAQR